jgi:hypothetical protein
MDAFATALREVRAKLRTALAPGASAPTRASVNELHGVLLRALVDFGDHPDGTKGQAWAILAGKAARHLEHAATIDDADAVRADLTEAETLLRMAIGDMSPNPSN